MANVFLLKLSYFLIVFLLPFPKKLELGYHN